jgi:succinate dehydrogenase / fumarate reductase iron-sulfur subunit
MGAPGQVPSGAPQAAGQAGAIVRVTLEVRRWDPELDGEPGAASAAARAVAAGAVAANGPARWQRYDVELPAGSTVLEALMYVQDHVDGSLAFRRSCRHGICGSCGMRVNGCARLACTTQLSVAADEAERRAARAVAEGRPADPVVRVEPLGNMPVLKDLVTDMTVFWEKLRSVQPWLQPRNERGAADRERLLGPHEQAVLAQGLLCVECGACYSDCIAVDASPEFIGPTALVKAYRYSYDARDAEARQRLADLDGEHGMWECTRCYTCTQRCPKHLRVRELIARLAELAQVEGLDGDAAVRRAHAFIAGIEQTGRLDERTLGDAVAGTPRASAAQERREPVADVELVRRLTGRLTAASAGEVDPRAAGGSGSGADPEVPS